MRPCGRVHKRGHVGGYANAAMWAGTQVQPCDQVHNHRVGQKRHYSMLKLSACSQRTLQGWQALTKVRYTNGVHGANRVWQTLWSGTQRGCMVQTEYGQVHKGGAWCKRSMGRYTNTGKTGETCWNWLRAERRVRGWGLKG